MTTTMENDPLDTIAAVLAGHADEGGWCLGCREQWDRLIPYPCTQVAWALRVRDEISPSAKEDVANEISVSARSDLGTLIFSKSDRP